MRCKAQQCRQLSLAGCKLTAKPPRPNYVEFPVTCSKRDLAIGWMGLKWQFQEEGCFHAELIREPLGMWWSCATVYKVDGDVGKHLAGLCWSIIRCASGCCAVSVPGHWPCPASR